MLVLTRNEGESIMIGDDIRVTFIRSKGSRSIHIGIEAPKEVKIVREELLGREDHES